MENTDNVETEVEKMAELQVEFGRLRAIGFYEQLTELDKTAGLLRRTSASAEGQKTAAAASASAYDRLVAFAFGEE